MLVYDRTILKNQYIQITCRNVDNVYRIFFGEDSKAAMMKITGRTNFNRGHRYPLWGGPSSYSFTVGTKQDLSEAINTLLAYRLLDAFDASMLRTYIRISEQISDYLSESISNIASPK